MIKLLSKHIYDIEPPAFGLDISDFVLKIAFLGPKDSGFYLKSFIETPIPEGIVQSGEIKKPDELLKIFKDSIANIKGEKIKTKFVCATIPERKSFLRIIQLPKMEESEIQNAVRYEIEQNIPLSLNETHYDWQIMGESSAKLDHQDILVAVAPKSIVDPYNELIRSAGLMPRVFELESIATSRSIVKDLKTESPTLIINLGSTQISFVIFSGEAPKFSASINTPFRNHLTYYISEHLKISMKEAEKIKREIGLDKNKQGGKVVEALDTPMKNLVKQIQDFSDYYTSHPQHEHITAPKISKIILCGGDANLTGIVPFLSDTLQLPVELGNPWTNILPDQIKETPLMSYEKSLAFTSCLGIALRAAQQ